jgi:signal transduction histidine kinase
MVLTENNLELRINLNDFFNFALSLGAAIGMFYVAHRFRDIWHIRIAWTLLGTAISVVTVGAIIFAILNIQGLGTFPSIADGFFLAFYPIFGMGLILMSWSSLSKLELIKTLMDTTIVMLAAFLIFWILLIAPTLAEEKNAAPLTVLVAIAYPILDWALIFAILRVLYSGPGHTNPTSLLLLACAAISQVVGDGIYITETFSGTYVPGGWVDTLYIVNFSLLILVIAFQLSVRPSQSAGRAFVNATTPQFKWAIHIPNLWAVVAYSLLIWSHDNPLPISFEVLAWIVGGILGLVIARQIVAANENARLGRELQAELVERKSAEESLRKLNEELESRILERTVALTQEIVERKQVQTERENLIVELGAKNKELERFTYTVSHDLKSPLVTIRGFLGLLEKDVLAGDVERVKADTARIVEATNKMQRLLNELLELSRIGRMMNPPVDIPFNLIVQEAVDLVHGRLTERGVTLTIAENMPIVKGDRMRLVQLVQNLVDNSVKFMGGQANPLIEIGWYGGKSGRGSPIFFVKDNGVGIPLEHHAKIFDIFNKLNPGVEGTGIGLSLVKRIISAHGGKIWVQSNAGEGTVFYFTLAVDSD